MCRASKCQESHRQQYCKVCKNKDSDHLARDCLSGSLSFVAATKCRASKCQESHPQHYCKVCKNKDSNHLARDCLSGNLSFMAATKCRASKCQENHSQHYCKLCKNKNSDHLARDCPYEVDLYHGTPDSNVSSVTKSGLAAGANGRLGPGVYLTTKEEASQIAKHRNGGSGGTVFRSRVNLEDTHNIGKKDDHQGSWQKNYGNLSLMTATKCRASKCQENHSQHYCKLCKNKNSDHLARDCPYGVDLYHGTPDSNVSSVTKSGLAAGANGRLGPGVYLTTKEEASQIAKHRNGGSGGTVFRSRVNLEDTHNIGKKDDHQGSWQKNYDYYTSKHLPCDGVVTKTFRNGF